MTLFPRVFSGGLLVLAGIVTGFVFSSGLSSDRPARVAWRIPQVVHAGSHDDGTAEMRVYFPENPNRSARLFAYGRGAAAEFSPDGAWCAVHDCCLSDCSELRLYRRRADLDYAEEINLTDAAWAFFKARGNTFPADGLDHRYVNPVAWVPGDRPLLLVSLSGHGWVGGRGYATDSWLCLYDVERRAFRTDFAASHAYGIEVVNPNEKD